MPVHPILVMLDRFVRQVLSMAVILVVVLVDTLVRSVILTLMNVMKVSKKSLSVFRMLFTIQKVCLALFSHSNIRFLGKE